MPRVYRESTSVCYEKWTRDGGNTFYRTTSNASTGSSIDLTRASLVRVVRDADGWRKPTPYNVYDYRVTTWRGQYEYWDSGPSSFSRQTGKCDRIPADYFPVSRTHAYDLRQRALTRALLKLKDQNVNYSVAVAEMQRSVGLIANSLTTLVQAYSLAKKGRWDKVKRKLPVTTGHVFKARSTAIADRWLELQYGWLPLLSDIYGANEDVIRQATLCAPRVSVKSSQRRTHGEYGTRSDTVGHNIVWQGKTRHMCKVVLHYKTLSRFKANLSRFGVSNPALVAWELVPFSFVVDWAAPIGEWLGTIDADFGLSFVGGTVSEVTVTQLQHQSSSNLGSYASGKAKLGSATAESRAFRFDRTVLTQTPWPVPYVKNPLTTVHALSALALLRSNIKPK